MIWSAVLGAAALAMIGAAVSIWLVPQIGPQGGKSEAAALVPETRIRVSSKFPSPSESEAVRLVKRAIANRNPANVSSLFRMGPASAAEVIDFFKDSTLRDGEIERYEWLSSLDNDALLLEGVLVAFKGREKPIERLALLTPDENGVWKMDFDAFARSVKPSWDALLTKDVDHAMVRVYVGHDSYFNGPFRDEAQWVCYGIASPDIDEPLRGYCKVGSPEAIAMENLFSDGAALSRATLEIRHVKEGESRQFEITRILAKDWVLPVTGNRKG